MTFRQWLTHQRERDDPIGDFANDSRTALRIDRRRGDSLPKNTLESWQGYVRCRRGCREALSALASTWREYETARKM